MVKQGRNGLCVGDQHTRGWPTHIQPVSHTQNIAKSHFSQCKFQSIIENPPCAQVSVDLGLKKSIYLYVERVRLFPVTIAFDDF
jgi:hypothetical protein